MRVIGIGVSIVKRMFKKPASGGGGGGHPTYFLIGF
jgi:hypothetical protein